MENLATKYLKQYSGSIYLEVLPESSCTTISWSVLSQYISLTVKHCKLSLLANVTQPSDPLHQELALQLDIGSGLLQINDNHHEILIYLARKQLVAIPSAKTITAQCTISLSP